MPPKCVTVNGRKFFVLFHDYALLQSPRHTATGTGRPLAATSSHFASRSARSYNASTVKLRKESLAPQTHYELFPNTLISGPPPGGPFVIDARKLRKEFLQLQAKAHPDRHHGENKARAEGASARINEAYKTLQNPLLRAQYLLSLRGIDVAEDETAKVEDPELLMEVLETREEIEAAEEELELKPLKERNEMRIRESETILTAAFKSDDLDTAKEEAVKLRYWINIKESLDAWEKVMEKKLQDRVDEEPCIPLASLRWRNYLLTFFQVVFSDNYISDVEAESRLAFASSSSSARAKPTSSSGINHVETTAELSTWKSERGDADTEGATAESPAVPQAYEYMVLNSSPYLCSIPQVSEPPQNRTKAANNKADEEKESARAADRGWELLKELEGHCMYFISGWWSYSFCYNMDVKQFHQLPPGRAGIPVFPPMEDQKVPSYVLGKYQGQWAHGAQAERQQIGGPADKTPMISEIAQLQTKGDMRYLVQKLSGGTTCDLTGKDRKIEVQFHCHPQSIDRIGWIKEVSTCSYLMVIYTPRLCNDVAFLPQKEVKAHQIICQEIVPEDDIDDWLIKKSAEADRKALNAGTTDGQARPMVGGIEVGGMKIIGKDGRRIEPPKAANPSDGKTDVVAKSDPNEKGGKVQKLSAEDMKKLDLDPEVVEELRKRLQELAGDKGWTLEVVDGPAGFRELRGIVEGDDVEDEAADATSDGKATNGGNDDQDADTGEGSEEVYKDEL
ncbi:Protein OS-9 [Xylographa trunciseda]|nr:Protein OS-9 [Xylographa trunciseda]